MSPLHAATVAARLALGPPPPSDEPIPQLELQWNAPDTCPNAATVRGHVAEYLERGVPLRQLDAEASVARDGQRFTLSLRFDGQLRQLDAAVCDDLARAAAVILSLALVPSAPEAPAELDAPIQTPPDTPRPKPAPTPPPVAPRPPPEIPQPPTPAPRVQGLVRPDVAIGTGISPTLTTGRLAVGVAWSRARVELAGTLWTPSDAPDPRADGRRTLVTMGSVHAHGCGVPRAGVLEFPLCAGFGLGAVRVDDPGTSPRTTTHRLWAGATASVALVWRFRPNVGLWVGPELTVALNRVSVALEPSPLTYRTGPVAIRGAVGVEFHFPSRVRTRAGKTRR